MKLPSICLLLGIFYLSCNNSKHQHASIAVINARIWTGDTAHPCADAMAISEGKLADFVILDQDVFTVAPEKIKDIKVTATYVGGKKVYGQ